MPSAEQPSNTINERRFAALLAGCDTGNASEAEAMGKFRALRRMAADSNARIVDLLEMAEVRKAVDDQMKPARQAGPELQEALEEAASLRAELTERTRDMRKLADMIAVNEVKKARGICPCPARHHAFGAQSWVFEIGAVVLALLVMGMAVFQ